MNDNPMTDTKGVAFNPPPAALIKDVQQSIKLAVAQLPPQSKGAIVGVVTESGVNAAVVAKLDRGWTVTSFIGKTWQGPVTAGASVLKVW